MGKQVRLPYKIVLIEPVYTADSTQFDRKLTYKVGQGATEHEVSTNLLVAQGVEQSVEGFTIAAGTRRFLIRRRRDITITNAWRAIFNGIGARNQYEVLTCEAGTNR